jgi:hypothetical protein
MGNTDSVSESSGGGGVKAFPLVRTRQWRRSDTWEALWGLFILGAGVYWLVRGFVNAPNLGLRLLALLGGIALLAFFGGAAWSELKETFGRPGRIELSQSEIVLDSPKWFREPLRVPWSRVRLITIDESSGDKRRFPVAGAPTAIGKEDADAWLWRKGRDAALPQLELNPLDEVPNLAVVFDPPVEIPGRKTLKTFMSHVPSFVNRRIRVVTARVENAPEAASALGSIGVVRQATADDVAVLQLSPEEKRKARRHTVIAVVVMVLLLGTWIGSAVWYVVRGD